MFEELMEGQKEMATDTEVETIQVLYNTCYGGWNPSENAMELYNRRKKELDPTAKDEERPWAMSRHDPLLVEIFHELGREFDDHYSKSAVRTIPKKYQNFYRIREYDGMEGVAIDLMKYKICMAKEILAKTLPDAEKLAELHALFATEEENYS